MIRYHSIAHFAYFQVHFSLNHSQKDQWFDLGKERASARLLLKLQRFALFKIQVHTTYETEKQNRKDDNQPLICAIFNYNMYKLCIFCVFQPFLLRSFFLILLMSELLKIWFCQFARRYLLFFLLSAIAPKMQVCSRAKSDWAISKTMRPALQTVPPSPLR